MTRLPDRFIEDRALRDAARAVLVEDIENLRHSLSQQGIASRVSSGVKTTVTSRLSAGVRDLMAELREQAGERKGLVALLVGAIVLFFARGAIFAWLEELLTETDDDDTDDGADSPAAAPEGDPA